MTLQEAYQNGFTDGRKWWVRHLREIPNEAGVIAFEQQNESSPDWNPPNVCQENAKMQIRITESVWEKVKYIIEREVFEEMKRVGVYNEELFKDSDVCMDCMQWMRDKILNDGYGVCDMEKNGVRVFSTVYKNREVCDNFIPRRKED